MIIKFNIQQSDFVLSRKEKNWLSKPVRSIIILQIKLNFNNFPYLNTNKFSYYVNKQNIK